MGTAESHIQHDTRTSAGWAVPAGEEETISIIKMAVGPVPNAFREKSSVLECAYGEKIKLLDTVYKVFGGQAALETYKTFCAEAEAVLPH